MALKQLEVREPEQPKAAEPVTRKRLGMSKDASINVYNYGDNTPWGSGEIDKLDLNSDQSVKKTIETCRFFYTHDALSATVINKMVEIAINKLVFTKNGLTDNEFRVFTALAQPLKEFAENMALEYLLSGLVVPEYKVAPATKETLKQFGIKKYDTLQLPVSMWLRDPSTVIINKTFASSEPSYFIEVDADTVYFITNKGKYADGTEDVALYEELAANFPDFVLGVQNGKRKFKLENPNIIRRKYLTNSPYPIPFLLPALESLRHKRNLRRMDYSIASRVISAILLIKLGSDEFPVTEDDQDQFESIKSQMLYRNSPQRDTERLFMLFGNHTLNLEWVFPDVNALLDENKYKDVNQDVIFALGFPRILITGETERSNSSDAQYATMSPVQTMNNMREKILQVIRAIVEDIASLNNFKTSPKVTFKPLQLSEFAAFSNVLIQLYDRGNISRDTINEYYGFDFAEELEKRKVEQKAIETSGIPEFAPNPNSREPTNGGTPPAENSAPKASDTRGRPSGSPNKP